MRYVFRIRRQDYHLFCSLRRPWGSRTPLLRWLTVHRRPHFCRKFILRVSWSLIGRCSSVKEHRPCISAQPLSFVSGLRSLKYGGRTGVGETTCRKGGWGSTETRSRRPIRPMRLWQATFLVNEVASRIQYGQNKMSIQSLNAGFHIL